MTSTVDPAATTSTAAPPVIPASIDCSDLLKDLPEVNGEFEIGIAAGADPSISDHHKLVFQDDNKSAHMCAVNSAVWAFRTFPGPRQGMYATCAYCAVYFGLLDKDDGDWLVATTPMNVLPKDVVDIKPYISDEKARVALSVMIATKINWWVMNHHTGTGSLQGYSRKVAITLLGADPTTMTETATFMHTVGHWCSTRMVLVKLGIIPKTLIKVEEPGTYEGVELSLSMDISVRLKSLPAGTHKHGVAEGLMKRLLLHPMAKYSKVISHASQIADSLSKVRQEPYAYHIGARYLTSKDRADFNDADAESFLGRLGTFASVFAEKSTLYKSPHVKDKYMNYEDYDEQYLQLCRSVKLGSINMDVSKIIKQMASTMSSAGTLKTSYVNQMRSSMGMTVLAVAEPPSLAPIRGSLSDIGYSQAEVDAVMKELCSNLTEEQHSYLMTHPSAVDKTKLPYMKAPNNTELLRVIGLSLEASLADVTRSAKLAADKAVKKASKLAKQKAGMASAQIESSDSSAGEQD